MRLLADALAIGRDVVRDDPADLSAHRAVLERGDVSQLVVLVAAETNRGDDRLFARVVFGHVAETINLDLRCQREYARAMTGWLLIVVAFLCWLALSLLIGLVFGHVLRARRRADTRPGYITDWKS